MSPYNPTPFERFYDSFLQNSIQRRRYRITLTTGESIEGVPTSGSLVNPLDPNISFNLRTDDKRFYQIPFAILSEAVPAGMTDAIIRTIDVNTFGAGDLIVHVEIAEAEQLLIAEDATEAFVLLQSGAKFFDQAPNGYYKYLTVQGRDFSILEIKRSPGSRTELQLKVEPL